MRTILILEFLAFIATFAYATYSNWLSADIVWGLWITSLTLGYTQILYFAFLTFISTSKEAGIKIAGVAAFGLLAFFTFHFGFFHFVHSKFLIVFFGLPGFEVSKDEMMDVSFIEILRVCLTHYWALILAGFLVLLHKKFSTENKEPVSKEKLRIGVTGSYGVYSSVVKLHLLIIAIGFIEAAGLKTLIRPLALFVFFFPFSELKKWLKSNKINS